MQIVYIDLIPQDEKPIVNLSQFDNDRLVRFMLLENGAAYTLAGTENVECDIKKPDGNIVVIVPTIGANNYVDVYFTEQAAACYGRSFGELSIHDNSTIIGTCNFYIDVEISPTQGGIESDSAIQNLKRQVDAITMAYLINNTDEIAEVIANKIYPTLVVSGDIATFNTILQLPLVSVTADPLATEITRCGKNFGLLSNNNLDNSQRVNIDYENGGIKLTATGTYARAMFAIKIEPGKTYTVSFKASGTGNYNRIQFSDTNDWSSSYGYINCDGTLQSYSLTFTATGSILYIGYYLTAGSPTGDGIIQNFQIENGSTATAYEAYNGITKPIDEATTIITLTGINNVFTDNGPVTVHYKYFPDI